MNVTIVGAKGRMGQALIQSAEKNGIKVSAAIDQGDDPEPAVISGDTVIDFSFHNVTPVITKLAAKYKKPLIIGTTGHHIEERNTTLSHTNDIPIVWTGNFSTGVNLLYYLTKIAAQVTDSDFQPEVIEMHHRHKVDAPSGTAEGLINSIKEGRNAIKYNVQHGRSGIIGARPDEEIGVHSLRGGSVVGEHTVVFVSDHERIELTHKAQDRLIFADGAMRAAKWAQGKQAGLYDMLDVLGLNQG